MLFKAYSTLKRLCKVKKKIHQNILKVQVNQKFGLYVKI